VKLEVARLHVDFPIVMYEGWLQKHINVKDNDMYSGRLLQEKLMTGEKHQCFKQCLLQDCTVTRNT